MTVVRVPYVNVQARRYEHHPWLASPDSMAAPPDRSPAGAWAGRAGASVREPKSGLTLAVSRDVARPKINFEGTLRHRSLSPAMNNSVDAFDRPSVVVVVEDEVLLRMLAVDVLTDEGFVALEAGHADAALRLCEQRADQIDALFTDVRMPGSIDGLELARRVRARWPWIAVLIASGNVYVSTRELPPGTRLLPKPYDMLRVVDLLREMRRRAAYEHGAGRRNEDVIARPRAHCTDGRER
jgi:CheY-like chemotaxis protein